jgi:SlyX protein
MADTDDGLARRVEELETHLAHQIRLVEELDEMVRRQWDEIDLLKRRLERALLRLSEMEAPPEAPANRKPPHW